MKCPFCGNLDDKVIDSREGRTGDMIRRRRECLKCERRFTTYERIDEIPYMVIKKDGRRERFERQKILQGLLKACEKRPVATPKLEAIVDEIEGVVHEATERELTTTEIGEMIMRGLKKLDLHHHFCSEAMVAKLQELQQSGLVIDTSDPQNPEGDWRFVAVSE